jgi:hypothetical protein
VASTIPFLCPTASDLDCAPEHWISLSPSLCFRSLPSYEGLRNRGQDLGALHKATRDPLTPSLSSLPLTSCSSTSALLQPSILSVQGRVGASVALPPPTTPFPRIQHPIARSRLAGHWRVIPHLLVLRRIISSSTLDILLTRPVH